MLALGTLAELKASLRREEVIRVEGIISAAAGESVGRLAGVSRAVLAPLDGHTQLTVVGNDPRALLPRVIEALTAHQTVIQKIAPEEPTLEDVFLAHTGRTLAGAAGERAS